MKWIQRKTTGKREKKQRTAQRRREREEQRFSQEGRNRSREASGSGRKRETRGLKNEKNEKNVENQKRSSQRNLGLQRVERRRNQKRSKSMEKEWEEELVRRGTGYRGVRLRSTAQGKWEKEETWQPKEENTARRKRELGYGEPRRWMRPVGREVTVEKGTKRKRKAYGEGSREKVMGAAVARERRRPRSVYTGAGRSRKKKVGLRPLKSTKGG